MKKIYAILLSIAAVIIIFGIKVLIDEWTGNYSYTLYVVAGFLVIASIKYIWEYYEKSNDKIVLDENKIDDEILQSVYETLNLKKEGVKTYEDFKKSIIQDEDGLRYCYKKLTNMDLPAKQFCTASYIDFKLRIMGIDKYKEESVTNS